ncbi:hypothetical protein [Haloechinothrix salitolerans]|uniref:Uncharacterized protein n=1 Tax=Haloechinothrix salitolerans TaxID=926830 RepID=A0ABW2C8E6_9PSEU
MLGKNFTSGLTYRDGNHWVRVKSRGPVITKGVDEPTVRLTVENAGMTRRTKIYANRDYETRDDGTAKKHARREWILPAGTAINPRDYERRDLDPLAHSTSSERTNSMRQYPKAPTKARRRRPRPASLSGRSAKPRRIGTPRSTTTTNHEASPPPIVPVPENEYCEEACYWLPPTTHHVTATQYAILEALSELLWLDAPAARWREGELVEHDAPTGLTGAELTSVVHKVEQPNPRQVRAIERIIGDLIKRRLIERTGKRFRLRGWECLHTRRRKTRRAIEEGGGRAFYAYVRHSA